MTWALGLNATKLFLDSIILNMSGYRLFKLNIKYFFYTVQQINFLLPKISTEKIPNYRAHKQPNRHACKRDCSEKNETGERNVNFRPEI